MERRTQKKNSEFQMGIKPTIFCTLVGCSNHWATDNVVVSRSIVDWHNYRITQAHYVKWTHNINCIMQSRNFLEYANEKNCQQDSYIILFFVFSQVLTDNPTARKFIIKTILFIRRTMTSEKCTSTRARTQKYISIVVSLCLETFLKKGACFGSILTSEEAKFKISHWK